MARRAGPVLALAAILVHLGGTVGAYLHFALVTHEVCPEHGELVHDGSDRTAPRPVRADGVASYERGTSRSDDGHDLCTLTAALRQRAIQPTSADTGHSEPPPAQPLARSLATQPEPRLAGYRLAPKTSPPQHA